MIKKTFSEHEKESGKFALEVGKYGGSRTMSREEFDNIVKSHMSEFTGVDYKNRVKFLEANGYEVNRENLINAELSAKPTAE